MSSPSAETLQLPDPSPLVRHVKSFVAAAMTVETYAMVMASQADAQRASTKAGVGQQLHDQQKRLQQLSRKYLDQHTTDVDDLLAALGRVAAAAIDGDWDDAADDARKCADPVSTLREDLTDYVETVEKEVKPFLTGLDSQITALEDGGISQIQEKITALHSKIAQDTAKLAARPSKAGAELREMIKKIADALQAAASASSGGKKTSTKTDKTKPTTTAYVDDEEGTGDGQVPKPGAKKEQEQEEAEQETAEEIWARIEQNIKELAERYKESAAANVTLTTAIGLRAETGSFLWASQGLAKPMDQFCAAWDDMSADLEELAEQIEGGRQADASQSSLNRWNKFHRTLKSLRSGQI